MRKPQFKIIKMINFDNFYYFTKSTEHATVLLIKINENKSKIEFMVLN